MGAGMIQTRSISLKAAVVIIVVCTAAFIALGASVGYTKYRDRYDQRPQILKDQDMFKSEVLRNPNDVQAHLNLGWTYYRQGKKELALAEYTKAFSLDKNNIEVMYKMGLVDKDLKNYKDAELYLQQVLKTNPVHTLAAYTLAQVYRETKQYDKAQSQYLQARKLSPTSANIIAELGQVYEAQGKKAEAITQYRDALRFVPDLKVARDGLTRLGQKGS